MKTIEIIYFVLEPNKGPTYVYRVPKPGFGKIRLKKFVAPPFLVEKVFAPLIFFAPEYVAS